MGLSNLLEGDISTFMEMMLSAHADFRLAIWSPEIVLIPIITLAGRALKDFWLGGSDKIRALRSKEIVLSAHARYQTFSSAISPPLICLIPYIH